MVVIAPVNRVLGAVNRAYGFFNMRRVGREAPVLHCKHLYRNMGADICPICESPTHEIDWAYQNLLHKQWIADNPDAGKYAKWWSI